MALKTELIIKIFNKTKAPEPLSNKLNLSITSPDQTLLRVTLEQTS